LPAAALPLGAAAGPGGGAPDPLRIKRVADPLGLRNRLLAVSHAADGDGVSPSVRDGPVAGFVYVADVVKRGGGAQGGEGEGTWHLQLLAPRPGPLPAAAADGRPRLVAGRFTVFVDAPGGG